MRGINRTIKITAVSVLLFASCDRNRNHPGWDYFPDMFYSTAYETYTPNPNFDDGMTMRTPAEGTIPQNFIPFEYTIDPAERVRAGRELINPFQAAPEILHKGTQLYNTFCAGCHGANGLGDGILYTSKLYPILPRSLVNAQGKGLKDGEIYHTITLGFGSMGAHGSQVRPDERWAIITYIRKLQEGSAE